MSIFLEIELRKSLLRRSQKIITKYTGFYSLSQSFNTYAIVFLIHAIHRVRVHLYKSNSNSRVEMDLYKNSKNTDIESIPVYDENTELGSIFCLTQGDITKLKADAYAISNSASRPSNLRKSTIKRSLYHELF